MDYTSRSSINEGQRERLARALKAEKYYDSNNDEIFNMEIRPYSYQQEVLDKLAQPTMSNTRAKSP